MKSYCPDPSLSAVFTAYLFFTVEQILNQIKQKTEVYFAVRNRNGTLGNLQLMEDVCKQTNCLAALLKSSGIFLPTADIIYQTLRIYQNTQERGCRIRQKLQSDYYKLIEMYDLEKIKTSPREVLRQMNNRLHKHLLEKKHIDIIQTQVELRIGTEFYLPTNEQILKIKTHHITEKDFKQDESQGICYLLAPLISICKNTNHIKELIKNTIKIHLDKNGNPNGQITVRLYYCGVEHRVHMTLLLPDNKKNLQWLGLAYIEKALAILYGNSYRMLEKEEVGEYASTGFSLLNRFPAYIMTSKLRSSQNQLQNKHSCQAYTSGSHCYAVIQNKKIIDPYNPEIQIQTKSQGMKTRVDFIPNLKHKVIELMQTGQGKYKYMNRYDFSLQVKENDTYFFVNFYQMSKIMSKMRLWNPAACLALIIDNKNNKRIDEQTFSERHEQSDQCLKIGPLLILKGSYTIVILEGVFEERMPSRIEAFYDKQVGLELITPQSPESNIDRLKSSGGFSDIFENPITKKNVQIKQKVRWDPVKKSVRLNIPPQKYPIQLSISMKYKMCILKIEITLSDSKNFDHFDIYDLQEKLVLEGKLQHYLPVQMLEDRIRLEKSTGANQEGTIEVYFFVAHGISSRNNDLLGTEDLKVSEKTWGLISEDCEANCAYFQR